MDLVWEPEESVAIWLVYQPPKAPADALTDLLDAVSSLMLEHPWLLDMVDFNIHVVVGGGFNIHVDDMASSQAKNPVLSMGFFQFISIPTCQTGHMLEWG